MTDKNKKMEHLNNVIKVNKKTKTDAAVFALNAEPKPSPETLSIFREYLKKLVGEKNFTEKIGEDIHNQDQTLFTIKGWDEPLVKKIVKFTKNKKIDNDFFCVYHSRNF